MEKQRFLSLKIQKHLKVFKNLLKKKKKKKIPGTGNCQLPLQGNLSCCLEIFQELHNLSDEQA